MSKTLTVFYIGDIPNDITEEAKINRTLVVKEAPRDPNDVFKSEPFIIVSDGGPGAYGKFCVTKLAPSGTDGKPCSALRYKDSRVDGKLNFAVAATSEHALGLELESVVNRLKHANRSVTGSDVLQALVTGALLPNAAEIGLLQTRLVELNTLLSGDPAVFSRTA